MLRAGTRGILRQRFASMATQSTTPMEDAIKLKVCTRTTWRILCHLLICEQVTEALKPTRLEISNDSAAHSHHRAMEGSVSKETHFSLNIVSEAFKSKMQPARHRMVYALLKEELERAGGIHALQLRTKTPEEEDKQAAKAQAGT